MVDFAAQAREEERRRREEERKAREAAEQARKVKEAAEAKAKQVKDQELKTVNPLADPSAMQFNPNDNRPQLKRQQSQQKRIQSKHIPKLDDRDRKTVADYESANNRKAFDESRAKFKAVLDNPNHPDYQRALRLAPHITTNWTEHSANRSIKGTAKMAGELANVPVDVAQSLIKGIIRTSNQVTGNDKTKLNPTIGKILNAKDNEVGTFSDYGKETLTGAGAVFGQDWSAADNRANAVTGAVMSLLDMTPLAGGFAGARIAAKQGGKEGLRMAVRRATGEKGVLTQSDIGGTPEAEISSAVRGETERMALEVAKQAEEASMNLPDPVQIERQAVDAGKIDDGISSPSRTEEVKSNLTQEVERQRAEIQQNYSNQLLGLDQMRQSLLPKPLATELAGAPDLDPGMMARQADFEAPQVDPIPAPELEVPSKAPLAQPVDTPNEAASKAAAEATPPPAPSNVAPVKTRTIDDMTDEEVLQRFGKTREEIAASRAELEAEKASKAERAKAKEDRKAQRTAAAEQAAADAGEAPAKKDLFAGKKRNDAPSKEPTIEENAAKRASENREWAKASNDMVARAEKKVADELAIAKKGGLKTTAGVKEARKELREAKSTRDSFDKRANAFEKLATPSKKPTAKQNEQAANRGEFIDSKKAEKEQQAKNRAAFIAEKKAANPEDPNIAKYEASDKKLTEKGKTEIEGYKEADKKLPGDPRKQPEPQPKTEWADEYNGRDPRVEEAPSKSNDILAGKKRTTAEPAEAAPAKKATGINEKGSQTNTERTFVAGDKTVEAKPSKAAPKKADDAPSEYDTDFILEKAKTGEKTRSESKTSKGTQTRREQEVTSRDIITDESRAMARRVDAEGFANHAVKKARPTSADEQVAQAILNSGRARGNKTLEGKLEDIIFKARNLPATDSATTYRFDRATASPYEMRRDFNKSLADKDVNVPDEGLDRVEELSKVLDDSRKTFAKNLEQAVKSKSKDDIKALRQARDDMFTANKRQKIAEYEEARKEMKAMEKRGDKLSEEQFAHLAKLKKRVNVFQYDAVDSSLLSASGTMINNALNGFFGLTESALVGKGAARIAGKVVGFTHRKSLNGKKVVVGGNSVKGTAMGYGEGARSIVSEVKARNAMNSGGPMKKLWGGYKNVVTTGNELSETTIRARIMGKTYDHYMQLNKQAGLKGKELRAQSEIDAITDPEQVRQLYEGEAYGTQGMSDLQRADSKDPGGWEKNIREGVSGMIMKRAGVGDTIQGREFADYVGKLTSRFLVGFPSVVWRSGVKAGLKRTPGVGILLDANTYRKAGTAQEKAVALQQGLEHAVSSGTYAGVGMFLGASGILSGSYPSDPNEQERWQAEGRTEWSIKLPTGGTNKDGTPTYDYFDIRKSLGAFALPVMMSAQVGQNIANGEHWTNGILPTLEEVKAGKLTSNLLAAVWDVTPVQGPLDRLNDVSDIVSGTGSWADVAATATRMTFPAAGFLNEWAKINTANDSGKELEARNKDDQIREFANRIMVALPGGGEAMGLEAKQTLGVDHTATSVIGRIFGAQKGHNAEGESVVIKQQEEASKQADTTRTVSNNTFDKVLETMDEDTKGLYKRLVQEGKTLPPEKQKKVDDAIAGLADTDKDFESKFSQEGDWESQEYVLAKKKDKLSADKSTKPDKLDELDREIGRTSILRKNNGDPKLYQKYKQISQSELKKMLDDEDPDNYDPETAQALLAMDEMFTKEGLSWNTNGDDAWTKKKYDLAAIQKALAGRGGGGKKGISTNVSGLKLMESEGLEGLKYKTVGGMPNVMAATPRKNFKKTISIKRGVQL